MLTLVTERLRQGFRTTRYPRGDDPATSERFRGLPVLDSGKCADGCRACIEACPTGAISSLQGPGGTTGAAPASRAVPAFDLGRCLFCTDCSDACPNGAIAFTRDHRLAVRQREDLVFRGEPLRLADALERTTRRLFGRSLCLRQMSAGGCNACEADSNVLTTIGWDIGRFGIRFVASPRHADGLLVTGPVSKNMELALEKTWEAVASPKIVIAVGACAISGGPYIGSPEALDGASSKVPIDLYVPGCPPHPLTILDGILRLLGRLG
jgi:Ni,Fe-hydrogenase III small subunit/formate hydrogenlyase subunit 6/NADH:ubiquinone oxidoreductase subunit I